MSDLLPCRFCRTAPNAAFSVVPAADRHYVRHVCMGPYHTTMETAAAEWNAANAAPDPALLALGRLGAKLFDRAWIKSVGFVNEGGLQDDLDRDTVAFGLVRYEAPGDFQMAPGIADAIARLLAPDGAGEVAP